VAAAGKVHGQLHDDDRHTRVRVHTGRDNLSDSHTCRAASDIDQTPQVSGGLYRGNRPLA
jgi:hypothetical protein